MNQVTVQRSSGKF
uniref:Uncharacterized protein n=1 Tax=Arundo donax TaxID=35708 RepID=A0A0A8ZPZ4_ARUDO